MEECGSEEAARQVAASNVDDRKKALDKAAKAKVAGNTTAEKVASVRQNELARQQAQAALEHWQRIAQTSQRRKAEAEAESIRQAKEAADQRRAEEERLKAEREEKERIEREALNGVPDMVNDTPQNARARGYRRVNGHKVDRQEPIQALQGKEVQVKFGDNTVPTGRVVLIDASQLQPSHLGGQRNPLHFIDEAQPKERNDGASVMSAEKIAANIRPEEITSSVTAFTGAPSVNARGEVIQGNNRSAALREMWRAHPEQAALYKQYLIDHAAEFGLNAADIDAMQQPVLVNMLDVSDADAIALGQFVAQDTESGGVERIKPKNAVQKMGNDMRSFVNILLRSADDEASFAELLDSNGVEVLKWMSQRGYITPTQYRSAFDSKGNLTAEAKNDIKGIMYQSIFKGGSTRLEEMFNRMPAKAQKAILATAWRDYDSPNSERMIEEIQNSIMAYADLMTHDEFAAAKNFKEARRAVENWKRQYQIDDATGESYLPADKFSNFALHLATMYKGESQNLIQGTFNKLYDLIQGTQEANIFEQPDNTPRSLVEAIKETLNIDYNGKQRSNVLAGDSSASQAGGQGSSGTPASGERVEDGARPEDDRGGTVPSDIEQGGQGDIRQSDGREPDNLDEAEEVDEKQVAGDENNAHGKIASEADFDIDSIDFENNYVVVHQTQSDFAGSIAENGLRTAGGLMGTSNFASRQSIAEMMETMRQGHGHHNANALVIIQVPKSWFKRKPTLDDISVELADRVAPEAFMTVPSQFISNIVLIDTIAATVEEQKPAEQLNTDKQGNPIGADGKLITEKIGTIDELTDDDFNNPQRSVELPQLPMVVDEAIGANGKPVVIKKNIFEKNKSNHPELSPRESRDILKKALYETTFVGQAQPVKRPSYWVAVQTSDKNSLVVLEINRNKGNTEIVGWRKIDAKGLEKLKRQAEREGGQFLILTSEDAAAALSALPSDLPSDDKGSDNSSNTSELGGENAEEMEEKPFAVQQSKRGDVELYRARKRKGGVTTTRVVAIRNGQEVGLATRRMPMPDGLVAVDIPDGVEILGIQELREGDDGRIAATVVVRYGDGVIEKAESRMMTPEQGELGEKVAAAEAEVNQNPTEGQQEQEQEQPQQDGTPKDDHNNAFERQKMARWNSLCKEVFKKGTRKLKVKYKGVFGGKDTFVLFDSNNIDAAPFAIVHTPQEVINAALNYDIEGFDILYLHSGKLIDLGMSYIYSYGYDNSYGEDGKFKEEIKQALADDIAAFANNALQESQGQEQQGQEQAEAEQAAADDTVAPQGRPQGQRQAEAAEQSQKPRTLLEAIKTIYDKGKEAASKLFGMSFFDVAETPAFMKQLGLTGDKFTIRYGVISRHVGKDDAHTLTRQDWEKLPQAIQTPFAISEYYEDETQNKLKGYRLYTALQLADGSHVVVGVDVKNAGRDMEVNAIITVFGRRDEAGLTAKEKIVYISETITPEQQSLLGEPNSRQYPAERELSDGKGTKKSAENQANPAEKIGDVGEKIGGARKDRITEIADRLKETEQDKEGVLDRLAKQPVSKVFNFDYAALRGEGVPNDVVTLLQVIRDVIPSKPRTKWKMKNWLSQAYQLYEFNLRVVALPEEQRRVWVDKILGIREIGGKHAARMAMGGYDAGISLGEAALEQLGEGAGRYDNDGNWVSLKGQWYVRGASGYNGIYPTREAAVEALRKFAGKQAEESGKKKGVQFSVYQRRGGDKTLYITPKGKPSIIIEDGFKTAKEALAYVNEHYNELAERYANLKSRVEVGFAENRPRKGKDWRGGRDVSADEFRQAFGFRGVEFGNWVNQKERQQALNRAYDALMDLSEALGKSPSALSLNGELGMAFGARGGGKFAAHYEPGKVVINLTKTQGAGSLAHEWWHAVDNYFSRRRGFGNKHNTDQVGYVFDKDSRSHRRAEGERGEVTDAFHDLVKAINNSGYGERSRMYASLKSDYWSRPTELGARAFAVWVERKLAEKGTENDFLANNPRREVLDDDLSQYYPYPVESDFEALDVAFDNLFNTIQERVDEQTGNTVLFDIANGRAVEMTEAQQAAYEAVREMLDKAGIEVVVASNEEMERLAGLAGVKVEANDKPIDDMSRKEVNDLIDGATSFVLGKPMRHARQIRYRREQERRDLAREIYEKVLQGDFSELTLQLINKYIDEATPDNPYGRRISQRVPQRMERRLQKGNRANAVDALFTRISESERREAGAQLEGNRGARARAKEKKKELLKGWAIATGNWHTDIHDFTDDIEPIAEGKDSKVYRSRDGRYVIKFSKGKESGKFPSDIDAANLFGYVFPSTAYDIVGYGEVDGEFVTILQQPMVDIASAVTEAERVEYMRSMGYEPINKENTAFSNGQIVVADLQKGNIVKGNDGRIYVIDADVKLHTRDMGGQYSYPPASVDTERRLQGEDVPRLMTVYHGSGAVFEEFDHSHMGEGEGAQAYGWGSYVTEVESIGRTYATSNKRPVLRIDGEDIGGKSWSGNDFSFISSPHNGNDLFVAAMLEANGDLAKVRELIEKKRSDSQAIDNIRRGYGSRVTGVEEELQMEEDALAILEKAEKGNVEFSRGRSLYTVEIPDDTGSNYLDYKGKLSGEQLSRIWTRLQEEGYEADWEGIPAFTKGNTVLVINPNASGADIYEEFKVGLGSNKAASEFLSSAGFTGIKYPAEFQSGGRSDGAKNYVIFKEGDMKITDRISFLKDRRGVVYGAAVGNKIYLNATRLNPNTPIHEYTHLWDEACRVNNPELWKQGVELMKGTSLWNEVKNDPAYAHLQTDDEIASECHARLTGKDGAALLERLAREAREAKGVLENARKTTIVERLKQWLSDFWTWAKDTMTPWSAEEAARVTLEDFVRMPLMDLAKGTRLNNAPRNLYNPRAFITPVRGKWTKAKILRRLKDMEGMRKGYSFASRLISEFDSPEELAEHMFYHGTVHGGGRLKPSITMSDREVERYGGGGYGEKYWGVSVSRSKKIASRFSGTSQGVSIYPVILAKQAKVVEMPDATDASDLDEHIEELWADGVDAVWIGDKNTGEQELCIINPLAAVNINTSDYYKAYRLGTERNPLRIIDNEGIQKLYADALRFMQQQKNAPKEPTKPMRPSPFIESEGGYVMKDEAQLQSEMEEYNRAMAEYEQAMFDYENSQAYKDWQQAQEDARKNIRFQFIGEQGASRLDKAEEATTRLDNLAVARQMEEQGKDAKAVKLATGWERGADGKWRYEIPDLKIKEGIEAPEGNYKLIKLGDLIDDEPLFSAYPELKDVMVQYQRLPLEDLGSYLPARESIGLPAIITLSSGYLEVENPAWTARKQEIEQHPLMKEWIAAMDRRDYDGMEKAEEALKQDPVWKEYNDFLMGKEGIPRDIPGYGGENVLVHEIQHAIQHIEGFATGGNPSQFTDEVKDRIDQLNALKDEIEDEIRNGDNSRKEELQEIEIELFDLTEDTPFYNYRRLSGEVEARNVQTRMGMSAEERRQSLASETEDVAREDQLFLEGALGGAAMSMGDGTLEQVNSRFNEELEEQINGTLPVGHVYRMGRPSEVLLASGLPNLPIEMAASRLSDKSMQENHPFELSEIKDLPRSIQAPMAVFRSATHIGSFVVMTEIEHNGRNFVVAVETNSRKGKIEVNSIRSVHYRTSNTHIANWIVEGLLEHADKEKMAEWFSKQRYNSADVRKLFNHAANIVENHVNPKIEGNNSADDDVLMREDTPGANTAEEQSIIDEAKANGTYMKAPNGQPTKLTPKQWVQVRTRAFKQWFGDWELANTLNMIDRINPISVTGNPNISKKDAEAVFEGLDNGKNKYDGREITWVKNTVGKILRNKGFDASKLVPAIKEVFDNSVHIISEPEIRKEGHKEHANFKGYHHYVGKIEDNGKEYYVRFTVQELNTRKKDFVPNQLHSTFISDIEIMSADTRVNTGKSPATTNTSTFVDTKLQNFLEMASEARLNSSKVVDENGEPMVVYRGAQYDPLAQPEGHGVIKEDAYFTPDPEYARRYARGGTVRAYFLNIRSPFDVRNERDARRMREIKGGHGFATGQSGALDWAEAPISEDFDERWPGEYDGIILDEGSDPTENGDTSYRGISYSVLNGGSQVKSATDNYGGFSREDNDIRHRQGDGTTGRQAASMGGMVEKVQEIAEKLHLGNVEIVTDTSTLEGGKARAKGFYTKSTGKITIVIPNHTSVEDAVQTLLHEAVAHYGLRRLFGSEFDTFLDSVFENADGPLRRRIAEMARKHGWNVRTATEEYLATLAEDTDFEQARQSSWWQKVKEFFADMLAKAGFGGAAITDNELRYILWRSYENLKGGTGLFAEAADIAKQYELGVGNYAEGGDAASSGDGGVLYRKKKAYSDARDFYEQGVKDTLLHRISEGWHDYLRSVKVLQEALEKFGHKVKDFENVYLHLLFKSSVDKAQWDKVQRDYIKPLSDALLQVVRGDRGGGPRMFRGRKLDQEAVETYLNCKHGLERNERFAMRDAEQRRDDAIALAEQEYAKAEKQARRDLQRAIDRADRKLNGGEITGNEHAQAVSDAQQAFNDDIREARDTMDMRVADAQAKVQQWYAENRKKDYSGLTEIFDPKRKGKYTNAELERLAREYVADMESVVPPWEMGELWDRIHAINDYSLRKSYESGLISKDTYDSTRGMFSHYVPLRGFAGGTAADVYDYVTEGEPTVEQVVKHAEGRKSKAAHLIATMMNMAHSAVVCGNRNEAKRALLELALNAETPLLTVSNQWYEQDGMGNWVPVREPVITDGMSADEMRRTIEDFEQLQKDREKMGETRRRRTGVDIPVRITSKRQELEHGVRVKRNGKEYIVWVNGNPKAAQAINGLLNPDNRRGKVLSGIAALSRFIAANVTQYSLNFVFRNLKRDIASSNVVGYAKYGAAYAAKLDRYIKDNISIVDIKGAKKGKMRGIYALYVKYRKGTLDMNDKRERYFKEFVENGGETGYSDMLNVEKFEKQIRRQLKKGQPLEVARSGIQAVGDAIGFMNRGVENVCRFATYMASRESGMSILQSINDAKEASVNFNRKGSGGMGNNIARSLFLFVNPQVQGLMQQVGLLRDNPKRTLGVYAGYFALGVLASAWANWLYGGGDGDDDDGEDYYNINPFVRRSNLLIRLGRNDYAKIDLPQEMRPWYGLGEITYAALTGQAQKDKNDIAIDILAQFTPVIPLSPIDATSIINPDEMTLKGSLKQLARGSAFGPWVDILADENFAGRQISGQTEWNKMQPEWARASSNAWGLTVAACRALNDMTQTKEYGKGWINWNPSYVDHVVTGYLGGWVETPKQVWTACQAMFGDDEEMRGDARNYPILSTSYINTDNSYNRNYRTNNLYKWYKTQAEQTKGRLATMEQEQELKGASLSERRQAYADFAGTVEFEQMEVFNDFKKHVSEAYDNIENARGAEERKQAVQELADIKRDMVEITLQLPAGFSVTTARLLEELVHEYLVCSILAYWLGLTFPAGVSAITERMALVHTKIRTSLLSRTGRLRRPLKPW